MAQTLTNFELLLIDDGSLDGSGRLIDEYAKKDKRVKSFHKVNGGVSSARQFGLDRAVGEYVIHVDPDDWVEPICLRNFIRKLKLIIQIWLYAIIIAIMLMAKYIPSKMFLEQKEKMF